MRFEQFINTYFLAMIEEDEWQFNREADLICRDLNGQWEPWVQIEFAKRFFDEDLAGFAREVAYPNTPNGERAKYCDFVVYPEDEPGITYWVELKVLNHARTDDLASRFLGDINKLYRRRDQFYRDSDQMGALLYSPRWAKDIVDALKLVLGTEREHVYCKYLDRRDRWVSEKLVNISGNIGEGAIVAYRKVNGLRRRDEKMCNDVR